MGTMELTWVYILSFTGSPASLQGRVALVASIVIVQFPRFLEDVVSPACTRDLSSIMLNLRRNDREPEVRSGPDYTLTTVSTLQAVLRL